jgi:hypothetical protein
MSTRAHVAIIAMTVVIVVVIFYLVNIRKLRSKFGLLWLAIAAVLLLFAIFPSLLTELSDLVGIKYPPTTFLLIGIGFLFAIVVDFSWELSRVEDRLQELAEELTLLRFRIESEHDEEAPAP